MAKRPAKKKIEKKESGVARLPALKPGKYADGLPLHEIQYLECKLILRPNHFTSRKSFFDFAKIMRRPAAETKFAASGWSVRRRPSDSAGCLSRGAPHVPRQPCHHRPCRTPLNLFPRPVCPSEGFYRYGARLSARNGRRAVDAKSYKQPSPAHCEPPTSHTGTKSSWTCAAAKRLRDPLGRHPLFNTSPARGRSQRASRQRPSPAWILLGSAIPERERILA